ncbi:MAG: hypothetical protein RL368_2349 [Pseudomonadota bacterium]|jgi:hypothetical protein
MRHFYLYSLILSSLVVSTLPSFAADNPAPNPPAPSTAVPEYKPVVSGAPTRRIGGGTRGSASVPITIAVLSPEHTGKTVNPSPKLYWAIYSKKPQKITFSLSNPSNALPVLEKVLSEVKDGIHSIDLAAEGIKLSKEVEYEWSVTVMNENNSLSDSYSSGSIVYVNKPATLENELKGKNTPAFVYAKQDLWYDALQQLSESIEHNAVNVANLRQQRAALLTQVGLKMVAEHEH